MKLLALVAALFTASLARAEAPHITQVLSTRTAKLGEPIELDVTVAHARGEHFELVLPESLGPFSVLGRAEQTAPDGNQDVTHLKLRMGAYALGKQLLPALSLRETTTGAVVPLSRDAEVDVVSSLPPNDPLALRDVAPPLQPFVVDPLKVAGAIAAALALATLLAFGARALYRKLRPVETEEQRDRRLLAALLGADDTPFYETLDGILRRSLARWHGVPALERTTAEIVTALAARPPATVSADEIADVLRETLFVRFAHRPSTEARKKAAVDVCQRLFVTPKGAPDGRPSIS